MAFTSTDLAAVETAIMDLAQGKRSVQIDRAGKTTSYQATDMDKLIKLRSLIQAELQPGGFINKVKFVSPT